MIFIHLSERKRERDRRKVRKKKDEERKERKEDYYVPGYGLSIEKQSAFQELRVYGEDFHKQQLSEGSKSDYKSIQCKGSKEVRIFILAGKRGLTQEMALS